MSSKKKGYSAEDIAAIILQTLGFDIQERNFLTRYGEIDLIAYKNGITHFIEVKSSYGLYNPAENFHSTKLKRFLKTTKIYCYTRNIPEESTEIDLALVNMKHRRFRLIKNANLYFN